MRYPVKSMIAGLGLVWLLLIVGCQESFHIAVGPNEDVTMFSDFQVGDERTAIMSGFFTQQVPTPLRSEQPFQMERTDSLGFDLRKDWRNLVFLADMTSQSWAARTCRRLLGEDKVWEMIRQPASHHFVRNHWATGQTVLFMHAYSTEALRQHLAENRTNLMTQFNDLVIDGLQQTLYVNGEQKRMSEFAQNVFGYRLRIPKDFVVEQQSENRYLRVKQMMASGAMMYLFVYYQDQIDPELNPGLCVALRDTLAARYSFGDRINLERTTLTNGKFLGYDCLELYGHYQNLDPEMIMGGLFKLFAFHAEGRLYLIDLSVYNPAGRKLSQLRTLEAIARTFEIMAPE